MQKLTAASVKQAKHRDKAFSLVDGGAPGGGCARERI